MELRCSIFTEGSGQRVISGKSSFVKGGLLNSFLGKIVFLQNQSFEFVTVCQKD